MPYEAVYVSIRQHTSQALRYLCRAVEHLADELTERFRRGDQLSSAAVVEREVG